MIVKMDQEKLDVSRRLILLLVIEALSLSLLRLAADVRFDWFGFFDGGAELTVHALMARGLRPTIDFGYIYGLLPLGFGDLWYRCFGLSPVAFATACVLGNLLVAWGIARLLLVLRVGPSGIAWVAIAMPIGLISSAYPSLTHIMERVLLTHALADLAEGRRSRALALAAACVFVKPSMAFLFGATVIAGELYLQRPRHLSDLVRFLLPAAMLLGILSVVLAIVFGSTVFLNSLVPRDGYAVYRANRFGFFFGVGRSFWMPPRPGWKYYVESGAGFWIAANLVLCGGTLAQLSPKRRACAKAEGRAPSGSEIVIVCAGLHTAFLVLFFGNQWSWVYYFNPLTLGVAAISSRSRVGEIMVILLALMAIPAAERSIRGPIEAWKDRQRSTETWDLWASPVVRDEWRTILDLTRGDRPALLATSDGAAFFEPGFAQPEIAFLVRGHLRPGEMIRKVAQIRNTLSVVVANPAPGDPWFDEWPEFADALRDHRQIWACPRLRVYRRSDTSVVTDSGLRRWGRHGPATQE